MDFERALKLIDEQIYDRTGKHLVEPEKLVLQAAWEDESYAAVAAQSKYEEKELRQYWGFRLWRLLSVIFEQSIGKKTLRLVLEQKLEGVDTAAAEIGKNGRATYLTKELAIVGRPPEVTNFYGREQELAELEKKIGKQQCVVLTGAAGIGKSALAAKLIAQVSGNSEQGFDGYIWKSVSYAPLLQDLIGELLRLTGSSVAEEDLPKPTQAKISLLLERLRSHRFLLVLDAAEALLRGDRNYSFNPYGEQHEDYKVFFQRLIEEQNQSCLLLTSREPLADLTFLEAAGRPIVTQNLQGLDSGAAMQLLESKGLIHEEKCNELIQKYWGNPSDLIKVVNQIQLLFGNDNERFFQQHKTTLIGPNSQCMLDELFGQTGLLSKLQREIMIYLAWEFSKQQKPISFTQLVNDFKNRREIKLSESELSDALINLKERALIERIEDPVTKEVGFTQRPVVRKYILTDPKGLIQKFSTTAKSA